MKSKKLRLPRIVASLFKGFFSLAALAFLLIPVTAHAVVPVTVAWDQNEPVPGGYILHWGTSSRNYTNSHSVGDATQYTVPDLQEGTTYYFAATAYDDTGNVSAYSTEISYTVNSVDSDGDGVPDDQDAFPNDPDETIDTDGDGIGNNADNDDDGDGMPDAWEIVNHLDPLVNDAAGDPDGDGITNLKEYQEGTGPYTYEDLSAPDAPVILTPFDDEVVSLTPPLTVDYFYDPDIDDFQAESQWQIFRADDNFCVLDVTSPISLTSLKVPKLILEEDTDYTWKVRFINNHDVGSDWSDIGTFTTDFTNHDSDGNGIPDYQEVDSFVDLDEDGLADIDQDDIKCVNVGDGSVQIGVSIRDSETVQSIAAIESENPANLDADSPTEGKPDAMVFGLLNFKLIVDEPGAEAVVTIHLSEPASYGAIWYKYDSVNKIWQDYSEYTEFSADRKSVYLTLTDGGFGDVDGIENGIIVDPLTVGTDSPAIDSSGSSESAFDEFMDSMLSNVSCFISTAADQPGGKSNIWSEIRGRELAILFIVILFAYIGKIVFDRKQFYQGKTPWLNS